MSKDEYLITDAPLKALTVFAMPMIFGSFFQQVYNMADSIIVGQFVGSSALAAVGACAALTNVFICIALGAGVGAGVLVSRYFGARDYSKMKTIVSTSLISFLVLSILLGVTGFCFSRSMMGLLQTPADILEEAVLYLRVYFVGFPFGNSSERLLLILSTVTLECHYAKVHRLLIYLRKKCLRRSSSHFSLPWWLRSSEFLWVCSSL